MRRPTAFSSPKNLFRAGVAGALVLVTVLACSESMSPNHLPDGVVRVHVDVVGSDLSAAEKDALSALSASEARNVPIGVSSNVVVAPRAAVAMACGNTGAFAGYTKSKVEFAPEEIPRVAPFPLKDDGYIPDTQLPLGFNFSYYGKSYDRVNLFLNGFLVFGTLPAVMPSTYYFEAQRIYETGGSKSIDNVLAFAWTDWNPKNTPDGVRYETRGTAPNRRFVLQFNNVPESGGAGSLTSQVVLSEGSNDITIYTTKMNTLNSRNFVTQGLENATGTEAVYDSVVNKAGVLSQRVRNAFALTNDAVRFSLVSTKDEVKPEITAPADADVGNDPGLATAIVTIVPPVATDNCGDATVSMVRSDGATTLDAPFRVGVTTITWTATDAAGNTNFAVQSVTVRDIEAPVVNVPASFTVPASTPNGALVEFNVVMTDNVAITSRSCSPASGSMFPIGTVHVTCVASDAAGHQTEGAFDVNVLDAATQTRSLIEYIIDLGLAEGTTNPLVNQLRAALSESANSCKKMSDFVDMLSKKKGTVSESDFAYINAEAQRIMNVMGCPATTKRSNTVVMSPNGPLFQSIQ